jgi:hypothetical protein
VATLLAVVLAACGSSGSDYVVGVRQTADLTVTIESRPAPPRAGNNEVVIGLETRTGRRPVYDAQVFVRSGATPDWVQAIEDGHVGVYRRAVNMGPGGQTQIEVRIQRGDHLDVVSVPVQVR